MEELIGIYKGLRMPALGVIFLFVALYTFWPSRKKSVEQAKFDMLDDDLDPDLSSKFTVQEEPKV